jgi:alpha-tubulin suppressor-like RCC1 family protein
MGALMGTLQLGCSGSDELEASGDEAGLGTVIFELSAVPQNVACIRIAVTGAQFVVKDFSVAPGQATSSLLMSRLPLGPVDIAGAAYNQSCTSIGSNAAAWVADPSNVVLEAGIVSTLDLTFRRNNAVTANVNFVGNVEALEAGGDATVAVIEGEVYAWGTLASAYYPTPAKVSNLTGIASVGLSSTHGCAVNGVGVASCWGHNANGQIGPNGTIGTYAVTPVQVTGSGYTMIATGGGSSCAVELGMSRFWCWGKNVPGLTPTSPLTQSVTPVNVSAAVGGAPRAVALGADHACVAGPNGTVTCWGKSSSGQVVPGMSPPTISQGLPGITTAVDVAVGNSSSYAVLADGTIQAWGQNWEGQLGDGTSQDRTTLVKVIGVSNAVQVVAGAAHACALMEDGSVKCWGDNSSAQLGDESAVDSAKPVAPANLPPVEKLAAGTSHTCALTLDHEIYCWGSNAAMQMADGTRNTAFAPKAVRLP